MPKVGGIERTSAATQISCRTRKVKNLSLVTICHERSKHTTDRYLMIANETRVNNALMPIFLFTQMLKFSCLALHLKNINSNIPTYSKLSYR